MVSRWESRTQDEQKEEGRKSVDGQIWAKYSKIYVRMKPVIFITTNNNDDDGGGGGDFFWMNIVLAWLSYMGTLCGLLGIGVE